MELKGSSFRVVLPFCRPEVGPYAAVGESLKGAVSPSARDRVRGPQGGWPSNWKRRSRALLGRVGETQAGWRDMMAAAWWKPDLPRPSCPWMLSCLY